MPNDLQPSPVVELRVELTNRTSSCAIRGASLIETLPDGVWLDLPARSCAGSHVLRLQVEIRAEGKPSAPARASVFAVLGEAVEIQAGAEPGRDFVLLRVKPYALEDWQRLLARIEAAQAAVRQRLGNPSV